MGIEQQESPVAIAESMDADWALVQACQQGDDDAFDALMLRYKDRVYNVVYGLLGDQDVAQEAYVRPIADGIGLKEIQNFIRGSIALP